MKISTKYNIGKKVYYVAQHEEEEVCGMCMGEKNIMVNNIESYCPFCKGVGNIATYGKVLVVEGPYEINYIKTEINIKKEVKVFYNLFPLVGCYQYDSYRAPSSRNHICEEDIFTTKEEANKELLKK